MQPPPSPAWAKFTLMMECSRCYSVSYEIETLCTVDVDTWYSSTQKQKKCHSWLIPPVSVWAVPIVLNIELDLQSLFGIHLHSFTHWLRPHKHPPSIWAQIRGRYWSANIDDISLWPPVCTVLDCTHSLISYLFTTAYTLWKAVPGDWRFFLLLNIRFSE